MVKGILTNHPPVKKEEPITLEEIERWFDSDPEAPVVLYSLPPDEHSWESRRIQITVNQLAVERHLNPDPGSGWIRSAEPERSTSDER